MSLRLHAAGEKGGLIDTPGAGVILFVSLAERPVGQRMAAALWRHPVTLARDTSIGELRNFVARDPLQPARSGLEVRL